MTSLATIGSTASRLRRDRSGLALLEFAFSFPIVFSLGMLGVETANVSLMNLKVSQITQALSDNAARVGVTSSLATTQLRELDMNDVLQATRLQGKDINLTMHARITVSSLEQGADGVQRIHWQRCMGLKGKLASESDYPSSYGITATNGQSTGTVYDPTAGVDTDAGTNDNAASHPGSVANGGTKGGAGAGMGDAGAKVLAPPGSGVMFVEVNYEYQPIIGHWLTGDGRIHYIGSFIVRDKRVFTEIYNPSPSVAASTCDKFTV